MKKSKSVIKNIKVKGELNDKGEEVLDSTPVAIPIGFEHPEPLEVKIRRLVRSEQLRMFAQKEQKETFAESDDFDVDEEYVDEFTKNAPYEINFDPGSNYQNPAPVQTVQGQQGQAGITEEIPQQPSKQS